jgi:hypothetical protein
MDNVFGSVKELLGNKNFHHFFYRIVFVFKFKEASFRDEPDQKGPSVLVFAPDVLGYFLTDTLFTGQS